LFDNLVAERHVALFAPDFVNARRLRVNGLRVIKDGQIYLGHHEIYQRQSLSAVQRLSQQRARRQRWREREGEQQIRRRQG
jgi:hypothetical protein